MTWRAWRRRGLIKASDLGAPGVMILAGQCDSACPCQVTVQLHALSLAPMLRCSGSG